MIEKEEFTTLCKGMKNLREIHTPYYVKIISAYWMGQVNSVVVLLRCQLWRRENIMMDCVLGSDRKD